jgi:anti-sigma regulatory factor (Ser/Thr protein kinase)
VEPTGWLRLEATPRAPSTAREHVLACADGLDPVTRTDALLVVSELVTNGCRHGAQGKGAVAVRCEPLPGGLRLEVCDPGPGFSIDEPALPPVGQRGGRGLYLIAALAARWGTARREDGFIVWAEIRAGGAPG